MKDSLDLNMLEIQLNSTPEVKNAEIFVQPEGVLSLQITERQPLFKVVSDPPFFSDASGALFAFQTLDSIHYPEFYASTPTLSMESTAALISSLKTDPFLARELKSIRLEKNQYHLHLKSYDFQVVFGTPDRAQEKINKLKMFCAFQNVQDSLKTFQKINLSYKRQVVASTF
jgi:cell division protein FtsQ